MINICSRFHVASQAVIDFLDLDVDGQNIITLAIFQKRIKILQEMTAAKQNITTNITKSLMVCSHFTYF